VPLLRITTIARPPWCPACQVSNGDSLRRVGDSEHSKSKRSEIPDANISSAMDSDTMKRPRQSPTRALRFRSGEDRHPVGQRRMCPRDSISPNVRSSGRDHGDLGVCISRFPSLRNATFQLVTQVAGRPVRAMRGGRVIVQNVSRPNTRRFKPPRDTIITNSSKRKMKQPTESSTTRRCSVARNHYPRPVEDKNRGRRRLRSVRLEIRPRSAQAEVRNSRPRAAAGRRFEQVIGFPSCCASQPNGGWWVRRSDVHWPIFKDADPERGDRSSR